MTTWRREVIKERLLLVEGVDEVNLVTRLLEEMHIEALQVIDAGGVDKFPGRLEALMADARSRSVELRSVGVVRDADTDGNRAFRSIQGTLTRLGLPAPDAPSQLARNAADSLDTAILIVPAIDRNGAIETLCWDAVKDHPAGACAEEYLKCLRRHSVLESSNEGKTLVHTFLASRADPSATVGVGAEKGYWPLGHVAFEPIRQFVRLVSN